MESRLGSKTASWNFRDRRRLEKLVSPRQRLLIKRIDSSTLFPRVWKSEPRKENSFSFHPAPMARRTLPPLRASIEASCFAATTGLRIAIMSEETPSLTLLVCAAR